MANTGEQPSEKSCEDGMAVIHVALPRMATASVTRAYRTLGYRVHHGTDDGLHGNNYSVIEEAAEATWPDAPGARPRPPFKRADWDRLFGSEYDIATDLAFAFVDQMIRAYPSAKVVVVQRNFDTWWPSFRAGVVLGVFSRSRLVVLWLCDHVLGIRAGPALHKMLLGFFGARDRAGIEANARQTYDEYYRRIREMVPPEKRLEFKVEEGWAPLCAFLGKEVPDVPFPRENDGQTLAKQTSETSMSVVRQSILKISLYLLPVAAAGVSIVYTMSSRS